MDTINYKFCPSCKLRNPDDAIICVFCNTPFKTDSEKYTTTQNINAVRETKSFHEDHKEDIEKANREEPAEGIAIYIFGQPNPIKILVENEFVIGRLTEATEEKTVDLTPYDGFALGVSRRHLMVKRVGNGYGVFDLNSRNGTWVDEQKLAPTNLFTVKNGSQIRLGNFKIVIAFRQ